ncbi:MAG: Maf family protein [Candidatus Poseidoniaceae archaeon]
MMRVWLASQSSRRAEMLAQIFPNITCKGIESVSETSSASDVSGQVLEICQKKASAVNNANDFDLVVVSDTMLQDPDVDSRAMGKAVDNIEAAAMLHRLSGRRHRVWSATGIFYQGSWEFHLNEAILEIDQLSDETLVELVLNNSWVGKAGCYDLAGDMGKFASLVEGEEATVLGIASDAMARLVELSDYET